MIEKILEPKSIAEILIFAVVFYLVLNFLRGTRAAAVLKGFVFFMVIVFIGAMYAASIFGLSHVERLLVLVLPGAFIALIVIFAPEMRRGLTRISQSPLLSPLFHGTPAKIVDEIVNAAVRLSKNRIGMMVAIEREVRLGEYIEQGVIINGELTHELLESIFYPGSALHDGAVIIQNDQVAAAGCLFPLTDDPAISKTTGTRHRAGIGLSEQTDAIVVIVSEETGRMSIAVGGKMTLDLTPKALEQALRELYTRADRPGIPFPRKNDKDQAHEGDGKAVPPPPKSDRSASRDTGKRERKTDKKTRES
ncbi:MAG: diadenylate cyclase CdaA [Planctomycetota bacterium]|jgi:diadenylate cyclase